MGADGAVLFGLEPATIELCFPQLGPRERGLLLARARTLQRALQLEARRREKLGYRACATVDSSTMVEKWELGESIDWDDHKHRLWPGHSDDLAAGIPTEHSSNQTIQRHTGGPRQNSLPDSPGVWPGSSPDTTPRSTPRDHQAHKGFGWTNSTPISSIAANPLDGAEWCVRCTLVEAGAVPGTVGQIVGEAVLPPLDHLSRPKDYTLPLGPPGSAASCSTLDITVIILDMDDLTALRGPDWWDDQQDDHFKRSARRHPRPAGRSRTPNGEWSAIKRMLRISEIGAHVQGPLAGRYMAVHF